VQADDAGHVHDRARAALQHPARDGSARVEGAAEVRLDDRLPVVVAHPRDQGVARNARVVDERVDLAQFGLDALDEGHGLLGDGDVRLDGEAADLAGDLLGGGLVGAVVDRDARAGSHELA
jgi:hypothetical protein